ncbi:MAG: hypothetical protein LCH52_08505 [Bacteroidetes bacterium]|nr:hypothetical protein [Bacteroidota bacterium]
MRRKPKEIALYVKPKFEEKQEVKFKGHSELYTVRQRLVTVDSKVILYKCMGESGWHIFLESELVAAVKKMNAIGESYYE